MNKHFSGATLRHVNRNRILLNLEISKAHKEPKRENQLYIHRDLNCDAEAKDDRFRHSVNVQL